MRVAAPLRTTPFASERTVTVGVPAARLLLTLDRRSLLLQHLRRDRKEIAREPQTDPAGLVQQIERIGCLVARQRQHTLVHGPEGDLAAPAFAAGVAHADLHACAV